MEAVYFKIIFAVIAMSSLALIVILTSTLVSAGENIEVNLPYIGKALGDVSLTLWTARKVFQFRGLPYVLPPTGDRRYQPPVPFEESGLEFNGKEFVARRNPRKCPQSHLISELKEGNFTGDPEDCLYLNVYSPKLQCEDSALLPVMMYISGGGLYEGSSEEFPPGYLLEKDVVVVVPQYRLGVFGFLSLQTNGIPGNVGFLDQLEALRWTKKNIRAFCGDPNRLTVFGQSAGAMSVALLHLSPLVETGLFQQAIIQSGSALANWVVDNNPEKYARQLANVLRGCRTLNSTCDLQSEILDDETVLKTSTALQILVAVQQLNSMSTGISWSVGGTSAVRQRAGAKKYILPETDLAKVPREKAVPLIIGVTANEGSFIASSIYDALAAMGLQDNSQFLSKNIMPSLIEFSGAADPSGVFADAINHQYFGNIFDDKNVTFAKIAPGLIDFTSAVAFKGGVGRTASLIADLGRPVWLYSLRFLGKCSRFGYGAPTEQYPFSGGVAHSNDLLFLWPFYCPPPLPKPDEKVAHIMVDLWTSFAANGEPTSVGVSWPPVNIGFTGPYLQIQPNPKVAIDFVKEEFHVASQNRRKVQTIT